jgi:mRNA-degrading endonuclease YafQ of YafQ-DinJ toxin-antitoxin module
MLPTVVDFESTTAFKKDLGRAAGDIQQAVADALKTLQSNISSRALRCHALKGYKKPTIYKIDVNGPSWQITFEMVGTTAKLPRLGTHKEIDRRPR